MTSVAGSRTEGSFGARGRVTLGTARRVWINWFVVEVDRIELLLAAWCKVLPAALPLPEADEERMLLMSVGCKIGVLVLVVIGVMVGAVRGG